MCSYRYILDCETLWTTLLGLLATRFSNFAFNAKPEVYKLIGLETCLMPLKASAVYALSDFLDLQHKTR
jgi:hypothetical protein